jgi:hypothetical protein
MSETVKNMNSNPVDVVRRVLDENVSRLHICPIKPNGKVHM